MGQSVIKYPKLETEEKAYSWFKYPTYEQYDRYKNNSDRRLMRYAYENDRALDNFPYIDHIPFVFMITTRQSRDILEEITMANLLFCPILSWFIA